MYGICRGHTVARTADSVQDGFLKERMCYDGGGGGSGGCSNGGGAEGDGGGGGSSGVGGGGGYGRGGTRVPVRLRGVTHPTSVHRCLSYLSCHDILWQPLH